MKCSILTKILLIFLLWFFKSSGNIYYLMKFFSLDTRNWTQKRIQLSHIRKYNSDFFHVLDRFLLADTQLPPPIFRLHIPILVNGTRFGGELSTPEGNRLLWIEHLIYSLYILIGAAFFFLILFFFFRTLYFLRYPGWLVLESFIFDRLSSNGSSSLYPKHSALSLDLRKREGPDLGWIFLFIRVRAHPKIIEVSERRYSWHIALQISWDILSDQRSADIDSQISLSLLGRFEQL